MSSSSAEREDEVSELREFKEWKDVGESDVVGEGLEKGREKWLP